MLRGSQQVNQYQQSLIAAKWFERDGLGDLVPISTFRMLVRWGHLVNYVRREIMSTSPIREVLAYVQGRPSQPPKGVLKKCLVVRSGAQSSEADIILQNFRSLFDQCND